MAESIVQISVQLLLPFLIGHFSRPWTADWINRNSSWLRWVDQSSILLVVYTAFSESVIGGLWTAVPPMSLLVLTIVCTVLLIIVLALSTFLARKLNFNREDEVAIVFRSEEHTSELQSRGHLVCRLLLEKKKQKNNQ